VRNGYADPRLLGVDRWVAAIGAWNRVQACCVVADVGTAATIDVVAADGGIEADTSSPGPSSWSVRCCGSTSDLAPRHAPAARRRTWPDSPTTRGTPSSAVAAWRWPPSSSAARRRRARDRRRSSVPARDGRGPAEVLPYLRIEAEHVPDLVLRGLRELARETV